MIHGWRVFICKMNKVENSSTEIFLDENSIQVTHTHIHKVHFDQNVPIK